jgi:hypothetical protein
MMALRTLHEPSDKGLLSVLKVSPILLASFGVFSASISLGFLQATLEPHMRQFNLSPLSMGKSQWLSQLTTSQL